MKKWNTHSQKHWDSIGLGIIGLGISLLMVGAIASLAFEKTQHHEKPLILSDTTTSPSIQVATAPVNPQTSTRVQ